MSIASVNGLPFFGPLFGVVTTWVTPFWLVTVGVAVGLVVLLVLWGAAWLAKRSLGERIGEAGREGVLQWIFFVLVFLSGFAALAAMAMPWQPIWHSTLRLGQVGTIARRVEVPPETQKFPIDAEFRGEELKSYEIATDQDLVLGADVDGEYMAGGRTVQGGETTVWRKGESKETPFPGYVSQLYVTNYSTVPANVTITLRTDLEYPQVRVIPVAALGVVALFLIYYLIHFAAPKVSAIAATTSKQAASQPIFWLALGMGVFLLVIFIYIPYNTFGEDVKMLKQSGLTLIMVLSIIVALWTASVSVAEEIEGRTALTLLSKPIGRRQFILGKYVGIIWPTVLMFLVLGAVFMLVTSYKVVYDARETSQQPPDWQTCYAEMIQVGPGLALAMMETVLLAAVSVAISTRLSMLANLMVCATVYVLGHLVPMIVQSSAADFAIVKFMGMLIATIFPVLEHFNVEAAFAQGSIIPASYLLWSLLYCVIYSTIAMLLALTMFEDRDLA